MKIRLLKSVAGMPIGSVIEVTRVGQVFFIDDTGGQWAAKNWGGWDEDNEFEIVEDEKLNEGLYPDARSIPPIRDYSLGELLDELKRRL